MLYGDGLIAFGAELLIGGAGNEPPECAATVSSGPTRATIALGVALTRQGLLTCYAPDRKAQRPVACGIGSVLGTDAAQHLLSRAADHDCERDTGLKLEPLRKPREYDTLARKQRPDVMLRGSAVGPDPSQGERSKLGLRKLSDLPN